jgi:Fe-S oxidoreductase
MDLADVVTQTRSWACYDCGKCTATCPIARTGGPYSPRRHVLDTNRGQRDELLHNGSLYSCLTCGQCDQRCPVEVGYTDLVLQLREIAYSESIEPQCPHGGALHSLMRMMAHGGTQQDRLGWLNESLETRPETGTVFYWTGCTMYYDAFFPALQVSPLAGTKAAVRLLNHLGIRPVVSAEERCCGHDLLWNGDREGFAALARHNVALVEKSGAETLVTSCAECLRTWKLDYAGFFAGKPPQLMHISELVATRWSDLTLTDRGARRVTFQDPCRLGRHLGIYEPPRQLLQALPGVELVDMRRSQVGALCCAGGTWSHCDRVAKSIQVQRLREARATGADLLVTACPKCQIHFRCAMKDPNLEQELEIEMRDLAEMVSEALA